MFYRVVLFAFMACSVIGQVPDKFENLKVLPKDITKEELVGYMRQWSGDLGVRCSYCHEGTSNRLSDLDFASDEKKTKKVARSMFKMLNEINASHFKPHNKEISCYTCHHGTTDLRRLGSILQAAYDEKGFEGLEKRYRTLRKKYYGTGSYNFGAWAGISQVAGRLERQEKWDEAYKLHMLNLEFNPEYDRSHFMVSFYHLVYQDDEAKCKEHLAAAMNGNAFWTPRNTGRAASQLSQDEKVEKAMQFLEVLIQVAPENADSYFQMGHFLESQSDIKGAKRAYATALQKKEDHDQAKKALEALTERAEGDQ